MSTKTVECSNCNGTGALPGRQVDVDHFESDVTCSVCGGEGDVENPDYDPTPTSYFDDGFAHAADETYRQNMRDAGRGHLLKP